MTAVHEARGIARYFAGELDGGARDALFVHLTGCEACKAAFEAESAAHRALSGRAFGAVELSAMMSSVVEGAAPVREARRAPWARWGLALAGAAAGLGVLLMVAPALLVPNDPTGGLTPKGAPHGAGALIEVLCFDAQHQVTARRRESGTCAAPARVKVVFARTAPVPVLTVVVRKPTGEVVLSEVLRSPAPLAVVPGNVALASGEVVEVIAIEGDALVPLDVAKTAVPVLTLRGAP